jgi:hypothetical protein
MADYDFTHISDVQLVDSLDALVLDERRNSAQLLAHLSEVEERRLYSREAFSSMYDYCVKRLRMAEGSAYRRIRSARATRRFPIILDMVAKGKVHLSAIAVLEPHLDDANHRELLEAAVHRTKREVEILVAQRFPAPDVRALVRKVPERRAVEPACAPAAGLVNDAKPAVLELSVAPPVKPTVVAPLAPERFKVQFTASGELVAKLRRAQDLLRHQLPDGDVATVCERALDVLLAELEKKRFGKVKKPRASAKTRSNTRHVPNEVKRQVVARDGMQCAFRDVSGRRCGATGFLELHHIQAFALGGAATSENLTLYCRAHNNEAARRDFGAALMGAFVTGDKPSR